MTDQTNDHVEETPTSSSSDHSSTKNDQSSSNTSTTSPSGDSKASSSPDEHNASTDTGSAEQPDPIFNVKVQRTTQTNASSTDSNHQSSTEDMQPDGENPSAQNTTDSTPELMTHSTKDPIFEEGSFRKDKSFEDASSSNSYLVMNDNHDNDNASNSNVNAKIKLLSSGVASVSTSSDINDIKSKIVNALESCVGTSQGASNNISNLGCMNTHLSSFLDGAKDNLINVHNEHNLIDCINRVTTVDYKNNPHLVSEVNKSLIFSPSLFLAPVSKDNALELSYTDIALAFIKNVYNSNYYIRSYDESVFTSSIFNARLTNVVNDDKYYLSLKDKLFSKASAGSVDSASSYEYLDTFKAKELKYTLSISDANLFRFINDNFVAVDAVYNNSLKYFAFKVLREVFLDSKELIITQANSCSAKFNETGNDVRECDFIDLALNNLAISISKDFESAFNDLVNMSHSDVNMLINLFRMIHIKFYDICKSVRDPVQDGILIRDYIVEAIRQEKLVQFMKMVPSVQKALSYDSLVKDIARAYHDVESGKSIRNAVAHDDMNTLIKFNDFECSRANVIESVTESISAVFDNVFSSLTHAQSFISEIDYHSAAYLGGLDVRIYKTNGLLPLIYFGPSINEVTIPKLYDLTHISDYKVNNTSLFDVENSQLRSNGIMPVLVNASKVISSGLDDVLSTTIDYKNSIIANSLSISTYPIMTYSNDVDLVNAVNAYFDEYYLCLGPSGLFKVYKVGAGVVNIDTYMLTLTDTVYSKDPSTALILNSLTNMHPKSYSQMGDEYQSQFKRSTKPFIKDVSKYIDRFLSDKDLKYRFDISGDRYVINTYDVPTDKQTLKSINGVVQLTNHNFRPYSTEVVVNYGIDDKDIFSLIPFTRDMFRVDSRFNNYYDSITKYNTNTVKGGFFTNPSIVYNGLNIYSFIKYDTNLIKCRNKYKALINLLDYAVSSTFIGVDISSMMGTTSENLFSTALKSMNLDVKYVVDKLIDQLTLSSYDVLYGRSINYNKAIINIVRSLRTFSSDVNDNWVNKSVRKLALLHALKAIDIMFGSEISTVNTSIIVPQNTLGGIDTLDVCFDTFRYSKIIEQFKKNYVESYNRDSIRLSKAIDSSKSTNKEKLTDELTNLVNQFTNVTEILVDLHDKLSEYGYYCSSTSNNVLFKLANKFINTSYYKHVDRPSDLNISQSYEITK